MLIETKLRLPPPGQSELARLDLLAQLDEVAQRRLAIVSAPTGFGKSTLLAQWANRVQARGNAVGWLSADAQDNEIGPFLRYLVAAIRRADPSCCPDLPGLIASSPVLPIDTILASLVNDLNRTTAPLFLVIDDFHLLTSPDIARFLESLLAYGPNGFHLIIAARTEVSLQLAGLRARGQLVTLDEYQLRFSLSQTEAYLNDNLALALTVAEVVTLHHRTEGWVAGLHLASLSMAKSSEKSGFLTRFSGVEGDIADFLIQEVLNRQSPETLDFLLCTAILERFSAPLADALTGKCNSDERIAQIEAENLFVISLDRERIWFRYHALFADLLRGLLERQDPGRAKRLHLRAAQWLSGADFTADAVQHALAADEGDMAAGLVEACCMPLIRNSNIAQVRDWLSRLPSEIIAKRPRLQLAQVWICFHISQPLAGARILQQVRDELDRQAAQGRLTQQDIEELRVEMLVLTAGIASAADHSKIGARLAEIALREVPARLGFLRGVAGNVLGFCHYSLGNLQASRIACVQARESHYSGQSNFGVLYSDLILGLVDKAAGDLGEALTRFSRATELACASNGPGSYSEAMVGIFEAEILYERNDLLAAERLYVQHRPLIEECGLVVHDMSCKLLGARLAAAKGRHDQAIAALEAAERQGLKNHYRRLFAAALHERVKLLLQRGEAKYARLILTSRGIDDAWLAENRALRPANDFEHLAMARVLIAEDRPEAALRLMEPLAARLKQDGRLRRLAQVRGLAAIAALRSGNGLATICPITTSATASIASDLSPREAEIARLLGEGLTNRDISTHLSMAPDTVKWHLKNIFGKLDAENRTQAVLRLQKIGFEGLTRKGG
jgi:LuxR family maltose regulon positive regulatory protein